MESRKVTFRIRRFNPKKDEKPYYQDFELEVPKGMTILEALQQIKDTRDPTLSFRAFCRSAICGWIEFIERSETEAVSKLRAVHSDN